MRKLRRLISSFEFWLLVGSLLLALGFGLWGITYRLPYVGGGHSTDEPVFVDQAILLLRGSNSALGISTGYLLGYFLAGAGKVAFAYFQVDPAQTPTFAELVAVNNVSACCIGIPYPFPQLYLWLRGASVICAALSVLVMYLVGRELKSAVVGLTAAFFLAVLPLHVLHSHFIVRAIPGLLTLLLAFYVILVSYRRNCWPCLLLLGGFFIYLAVLTKRNNLILLAPYSLAIAIGIWREFKQRPARQVLKVVGLAVIMISSTIIVGWLAGLVDPIATSQNVLDQVFGDKYVYDTYVFGMGHQNGLEWLIDYTLYQSYVVGILLLSLPGLIVALRLPNYRGWLLLAVPLPYLLLMSLFSVRFHQWLLPPYAFLLILAALFLEAGYGWLKQKLKSNRVWLPAAYALVVLLLAFPSIQQVAYSNTNLAAPDARDLASTWLAQNLPPGATVAIDWFGPYLSQEQHTVTYVRSITENDIEYYQANGIEYVVGNSQNLAELIEARQDPAAYQAAEQQLLRANYFLTQLVPIQQFEDAFDIKVYIYQLP